MISRTSIMKIFLMASLGTLGAETLATPIRIHRFQNTSQPATLNDVVTADWEPISSASLASRHQTSSRVLQAATAAFLGQNWIDIGTTNHQNCLQIWAHLERKNSAGKAIDLYVNSMKYHPSASGLFSADFVDWKNLSIAVDEELVNLGEMEAYVRSKQGLSFRNRTSEFVDATVDEYLSRKNKPTFGRRQWCARFLNSN